MDNSRDTEDQILIAFLKLVSEQGLQGVTTRAIAEEAGVNPVTLFRRFGDKTTIALEAVRRYSPAVVLRDRDPGIVSDNPAEGLVGSLMFLSQMMIERVPWLSLGLMQPGLDQEVWAEIKTAAKAVYDYLRRALDQASPSLRPEVDHHVTALQWIGLLIVTRRIAILVTDQEMGSEGRRQVFEAAVRPLLLSAKQGPKRQNLHDYDVVCGG